MQCQKCGTELKEGAKFCNKCGHNVSLPFIEEEPFFSKLLKTIIQNIQNTNTKVWYKRWWVWSAAAVVGIMLAITIIIKMTELVEMVEIPAGTFANVQVTAVTVPPTDVVVALGVLEMYRVP